MIRPLTVRRNGPRAETDHVETSVSAPPVTGARPKEHRVVVARRINDDETEVVTSRCGPIEI